MKYWALMAIVTTITFVLLFSHLSYAFHANLGIDDNKASELYHSNPNDPAIVQWKTALQSTINGMDQCFDMSDYQKVIDCQSSISIIVSNCESHPNTLLACNDARLPQYPTVLKNAKELQIKFGQEQKINEKRQIV